MGLMSETNKMLSKIEELIAMNDIEPIHSFNSTSPNSWRNLLKQQDKLMDEIEELAIKHNTILGRIVKFPMGDGYAIYIITKVNKKSARLTWVKYCDAWQDDRIGYEANVDIDYVKQKVAQRDALNKLFRNKQPTT